MAFVQLALSLVILGALYIRMIRREAPTQVSKAQAIVPVALGVVSLALSFGCFMALMTGLGALGVSLTALPAFPRSVCMAFLTAGLPEELAKLLMMLVAIRIFRAGIKNVYDYILIGAAVGFGFTLFEEFLYGSESPVLLAMRLIIIAAHMAFGMIMAKHLGLARHHQATGSGSVGGERAKAVLTPVLIHTLFDAFTAQNFMLMGGDDTKITIGLVLGLAATIGLFILQIRVLVAFRKNAKRYCDMSIA